MTTETALAVKNSTTATPRKNFSKNLEKPLDKSKKLWYNKDTEKERKGKQNEYQDDLLRHGWDNR